MNPNMLVCVYMISISYSCDFHRLIYVLGLGVFRTGGHLFVCMAPPVPSPPRVAGVNCGQSPKHEMTPQHFRPTHKVLRIYRKWDRQVAFTDA